MAIDERGEPPYMQVIEGAGPFISEHPMYYTRKEMIDEIDRLRESIAQIDMFIAHAGDTEQQDVFEQMKKYDEQQLAHYRNLLHERVSAEQVKSLQHKIKKLIKEIVCELGIPLDEARRIFYIGQADMQFKKVSEALYISPFRFEGGLYVHEDQQPTGTDETDLNPKVPLYKRIGNFLSALLGRR